MAVWSDGYLHRRCGQRLDSSPSVLAGGVQWKEHWIRSQETQL